ncbi:MAG: NAD(+) synthase [Oligoflexia bacterium]|nr:NAD(+) synthase [Oligoflexia bacterium]
MQIVMHQTHQIIGDFDKIYTEIETHLRDSKKGELHLYPELYFTGYPLQDLVLQRTFIERYLAFFDKVNELFESSKDNGAMFLFGGLHYQFDDSNLPIKIRNVIWKGISGQKLEDVYTKQLLPNYDIFDEEKYYEPGKEANVITFESKNIGLLICEDMWFSSSHDEDPITRLQDYISEKSIELDLIVNLSASPFFLGKEAKRIQRASLIGHKFGCPFFYLNMVAFEDEIIFDGGSFVTNGDEVIAQGNLFRADLLKVELPESKPAKTISEKAEIVENTWESLFKPSLDLTQRPPVLPQLSDEDCQTILEAIQLSVQDYIRKTGFKKFTIALSGGIDSALVVAILSLIKTQEQELEAIYMPGFYSRGISYDLSAQLCQNVGIKLTTLPIKFFHSSIKNSFKDNFGEDLEGLSDENIQSRLRGALLFARSNQTNSIVFNTSNKSEIAVGYSTMYGDSVGALSILGDLYKSEVFQLANYINKKWKGIIPEEIITRPPSAELREDQEDQQSLPPYERLDAILEGLLSYRLSLKELHDLGLDQNEIEKTYDLYNKSEYKRRQFCPIIKLKAKSFGFGYRVPITKSFK